MHCYIPEELDEAWAQLRHLGRRRAQLITSATASVQRVRDFLSVAWPAAPEACAHPFTSVTWLAAMQVVTSRCGGQPEKLAVIGLAEFTALVRQAVAGWGGQRPAGPVCRAVFAALASTEGVALCQVAAEGHTVLSPAAARRLIVASADRQPARDRARHLAGSLTDREAQVLACLGEGLSNAQIAARLYLSEARVRGYVSRMLVKLGCANRARAGLLACDAPVSSARSPGRRSCRLELGLGARQAGLRPSPGRSCPPGAAGLTGPPRVGGCCDHVVDAVGGELLQDQRVHGVLLG